MKKIVDLVLSQKLILAGNALITIGSMVLSIGSLIGLAEAGELMSETLMPVRSGSRASGAANVAQSYFT